MNLEAGQQQQASQALWNTSFVESVEGASLGLVDRPTAVKGRDGNWERMMTGSGAVSRKGTASTEISKMPEPKQEPGAIDTCKASQKLQSLKRSTRHDNKIGTEASYQGKLFRSCD